MSSNCCHAKVIDPSGEGIQGVCSDCGEHCGFETDYQLDEILTNSLKRAYFNGSTDVKARESGVIHNDTKLGEVMIQVLVAEAKAAIQAHTNAEIAKVLDRLDKQSVLYENRTPDDYKRDLIPLSAIEAERNKLKEEV